MFTAKKLDKKIDNALFLASGIAEFPYVGVRRIAQAGEKLGEGKPLEALGKLVGVKEPKKKGERRGTPEKRNVSQVRNQRNQFNADRAFKEMMK